METLTVQKHWRDVAIDPGVRPNVRLTFTNGTVVGRAVNNKIFNGEFVWPAIPPNGTADFQLLELAVTASGLTDFLQVDVGRDRRDFKNIIIMEVFRGESHPTIKPFIRTPRNELQAVHPNRHIGAPDPNLDGDFGWDYEGHESPLDTPAEVSRVMATTDNVIEIGLKNVDDFVVVNTTRLIFNVFEFRPFSPEDDADLQRILAILKDGRPSVAYSSGLQRADVQDFGLVFGVEPIFFTGTEIRIGSTTGKVVG